MNKGKYYRKQMQQYAKRLESVCAGWEITMQAVNDPDFKLGKHLYTK